MNYCPVWIVGKSAQPAGFGCPASASHCHPTPASPASSDQPNGGYIQTRAMLEGYGGVCECTQLALITATRTDRLANIGLV